MKNHKLYSIWDQVPVTYYQRGVRKNLLQKIWHRLKIRNSKFAINNFEFKKCLDIGCASGFMISEIAKAFPGAKYHGVDVYDKAIRFAKKNYPQIKFKVAQAENLPFKDNFFDLILCYETIEHVEDPKKSLKEMKRVLKNNGILLLTMDSGNWLFRIIWFIWENTKGKVWKGSHLHPFHHKELSKLIKKAKFKIVKKYFSHLGMEVNFILKK